MLRGPAQNLLRGPQIEGLGTSTNKTLVMPLLNHDQIGALTPVCLCAWSVLLDGTRTVATH